MVSNIVDNPDLSLFENLLKGNEPFAYSVDGKDLVRTGPDKGISGRLYTPRMQFDDMVAPTAQRILGEVGVDETITDAGLAERIHKRLIRGYDGRTNLIPRTVTGKYMSENRKSLGIVPYGVGSEGTVWKRVY